MSQTLSTQAMVNLLAAKLPYGIATAFFQDRLNEAYRWIEQQGPYIFDLKTASITFNAGLRDGLAPDGLQLWGRGIAH